MHGKVLVMQAAILIGNMDSVISNGQDLSVVHQPTISN